VKGIEDHLLKWEAFACLSPPRQALGSGKRIITRNAIAPFAIFTGPPPYLACAFE
jgi:hypothetical protein